MNVIAGKMARAVTGRKYGLVYLVDHVTLDTSRYDSVTQILDESHIRISADGINFSPVSLRLAYPPEFDLVARIAGLRLRDRSAGWNGEPFTAASWLHVGVYGQAPT